MHETDVGRSAPRPIDSELRWSHDKGLAAGFARRIPRSGIGEPRATSTQLSAEAVSIFVRQMGE